MGSIWLAILCSAFLVALAVPRTVNAASKSGKVNKAASEKKTVPSNKTPAKKERVIDSPYFISKWDKEREEREAFLKNHQTGQDPPKDPSHGPDYSTGCHPHPHEGCAEACEAVITWFEPGDGTAICELLHRLSDQRGCELVTCTGSLAYYDHEVVNRGYGKQPTQEFTALVDGTFLVCDDKWYGSEHCCEGWFGWLVPQRAITYQTASPCGLGD